MVDTSLDEWLEVDLEAFRKQFRKNPVKRARFEGFKRNVRMAMGRGTAGRSQDD
jgi:epoxyqueuosine reductase